MKPSLSSSGSKISIIPSLSVSIGKLRISNGSVPAITSILSSKPSLSSSGSELFPIPSPSVSTHSKGSRGNASTLSSTPSPSVSTTTEPLPPPPGAGGVGIELQVLKSSVTVIFTVVEAVFPEVSVTEKIIC